MCRYVQGAFQDYLDICVKHGEAEYLGAIEHSGRTLKMKYHHCHGNPRPVTLCISGKVDSILIESIQQLMLLS